MSDWVRSIAALGFGFAGATALTIGLAGLLVSGQPPTVAESDGGPSPAAGVGQPVSGGVPGIGGSLTVSGDREGTLLLRSGDEGGERYSLVGNDGRMAFAGVPAEVVQLSYDGLEFFPDPGECTLEAGNLEGAIGIGFVEVSCHNLTDVRGNGTIDIAGELGLPLDLLRERSLPPPGGSLAVGDETWEFSEAELRTWQMPIRGGVKDFNLVLHDPNRGTLNLLYDYEAHRLVPGSIVRHGTEQGLDEGACSFEREELGQHNPRTVVVELTISCPAVEVPGLGTVAVRGTVVVDELQWPI